MVKGKHTQKSLSATFVRAKVNAGRYGDGNGLYLIVDPSGAKRWVLRTVVKGKRRDIGLGGLSWVSLAEAREEATQLRKIARQHGDPLAERRKAQRVVPTFAQAAREVHKTHSASWKNVKHAQQWINTLADYVFPIFGSLRVDQIDTPEVLKALSPIWLKNLKLPVVCVNALKLFLIGQRLLAFVLVITRLTAYPKYCRNNPTYRCITLRCRTQRFPYSSRRCVIRRQVKPHSWPSSFWFYQQPTRMK